MKEGYGRLVKGTAGWGEPKVSPALTGDSVGGLSRLAVRMWDRSCLPGLGLLSGQLSQPLLFPRADNASGLNKHLYEEAHDVSRIPTHRGVMG